MFTPGLLGQLEALGPSRIRAAISARRLTNGRVETKSGELLALTFPGRNFGQVGGPSGRRAAKLAAGGQWRRAAKLAAGGQWAAGRGSNGAVAGRESRQPQCSLLVEAPRVAADLAVGDAASLVYGEIAGAAVCAAVGSARCGGSAPKSAHCDGPARDRCGRGSRMHSVPSGRASRGRIWRSARHRNRFLLHGPPNRKDRSGSWFPCPERGRERVGLYRRFASADLGILTDRGRIRQTTHSAGSTGTLPAAF